MRVLVAPDFRRNPYLSLLTAALRDHGVDVIVDTAVEDHDRDREIDVVHLHWERPWTVRRTRWATIRRFAILVQVLLRFRRKGAGVVWTVHNLRDHDAVHPVIEWAAQVILARLAHGMLVHYPAAVPMVRRRMLWPRTRIVVAEHGRYPEEPGLGTQAEERAALDIPADALVLAALGAVRRYKRIPELIEAARAADRDIVLIVAGMPDDDEAARVRAAAAGDPHVRLELGERSDTDLARYLRAADASVHASAGQLTSGSAVFAMSHGRAVVALDQPHIRFLCTEHGAAYFHGHEPADLVAGLRWLDRDELLRAGEWNAQRVAGFDWKKVTEPVVDLYRDVAARRPDARTRPRPLA